ncbi:uncharacterized protein BO80DRAFT_422931 [Aspergillus ibericus CBS 121593]|uniref:Uncharacterized protein n=1 Tax=Aspergillus ibericus CBS 121593 TaxID=1448316 RepID=A0A395HB91_9EURO|nr:hypothetical protein BO80DRAFT_422931 [Aspergillus ibericus CBS 121593]RAL03474.1 hypothetical protein BO80DRAFT_422931 [Aspergillus ibericus CBS 121593]
MSLSHPATSSQKPPFPLSITSPVIRRSSHRNLTLSQRTQKPSFHNTNEGKQTNTALTPPHSRNYNSTRPIGHRRSPIPAPPIPASPPLDQRIYYQGLSDPSQRIHIVMVSWPNHTIIYMLNSSQEVTSYNTSQHKL